MKLFTIVITLFLSSIFMIGNSQNLTKGSVAYYEAMRVAAQSKIDWVKSTPSEHEIATNSNWYEMAENNVSKFTKYKHLAEKSSTGTYFPEENNNRSMNSDPEPGDVCADAIPFYSEVSYDYPCATDQPNSPSEYDYGCLNTTPNAAWYYMHVETSGDIIMSLSADNDIDFIIWGPFHETTCDSLDLSSENIVDCSYSSTNEETPEIGPGSSEGATTGTSGEYYMFLITNYSNSVQNFTLTQTGGSGGTPGLSTRLIDNLCGSTTTTRDTWLSCNVIDGAEDYEFFFENSDIGYSETKTTSAVWGSGNGHYSTMRLYYIPQILHGYTYNVRVRAKVNGTWGEYGSTCQLTLDVQTTQLQSSQCNDTITTSSTMLYAEPVTYATNYEYHFTNSALGYDETITSADVWGIENGSRRYIRMYYLPNIVYGQTYDVEIRAKVNGAWGDFGETCQLSLAVQSTHLQGNLCGGNAPTSSTLIYATPVTYAQDYEFWLVNEAIGYDQTRTTSSVWGEANGARRYFRMYYMPGLQYGYIYNVRIRAKVDGVWGEFGEVCQLSLGTNYQNSFNNENNQSVTIENTAELISYPNPFNSSTNLTITTEDELRFNMKVVDVTGKIMEEQEIISNEQYSIGQELEKGIYFIILTNNSGLIQKQKIIKLK